MEPDVWNWVNEDPTVMQQVLKCCSRPECPVQEREATQFKRCAACRQVRLLNFLQSTSEGGAIALTHCRVPAR